MGCSCSSSPGVGLDGSTAKKWFKMEDVPVSLKILDRCDGQKGITVEVAGMDNYGLMAILGRAFLRRGFAVDAAEWAVKGALFHGSFHLGSLTVSDIQKKEEQQKTNFLPEEGIGEVSAELCCKEHTTPGAYAPWNAKQVPLSEICQLQIDIEHRLEEKLRIGFLALIRNFGGHTVKGNLRLGAGMQQDSFWVNCPRTHLKSIMEGPCLAPQSLRDALSKVMEFAGDDAAAEGANADGDDIIQANAKDSLMKALQAADKRAMKAQLAELPPAMKHRVAETPYKIVSSTWGVQYTGLKKFMGAGMVQSASSSKQAPLLQFTTLYVQEHLGNNGSHSSHSAFLNMFGSKRYAEFVNSIDVNSGRFTVEKVFLNGICPAGKLIGAYSASEQLFAPIWENGATSLAQILPVNRIKEVKLSDVVNWNTYAVMCVALQERGEISDMFGEHFLPSLNQELKAAQLTRAECRTLPLVDIVLRTCLGKLVLNMLELWSARTFVTLKSESASVVFLDGQAELIEGELRTCMDIVIKVRVESWPVHDVATKGDNREPEPMRRQTSKCYVGGLDEGSQKAFVDWAARVRDLRPSHLDVCLGVSGGHEVVRQKPVLIAVSRALHELQRERGWSCLAAAGISDSCQKLKMQRSATDTAFVDALQQTTSNNMRMVSASLILLRNSVDEQLQQRYLGRALAWLELYEMICASPLAFNDLIARLVEWLVRAVNASPEFPQPASQSFRLFCYFKESLGRERALLLCDDGADTSSGLAAKSTERQMSLLAATQALVSEVSSIDEDFSHAFQQMEKAQATFMNGEKRDKEAWFNVMAVCIDLCQKLAEDILGIEDGLAAEAADGGVRSLNLAGVQRQLLRSQTPESFCETL
eukprot:gb/GFBE01011453.1/.p1 GENE.gb/GFBE01011453.1/~~gb/GFBE01011453.1/.p1  ORF type:complete len:871 (+),score=196.30 gb/GFBE01011453.1/:1-2613(+)